MEDFNLLDICWENNTASCKWSRRFLKYINNKFLVLASDGLTRDETLLDLLLTILKEIVKDIKNGGSLRCSNHALFEFVILRNIGLAKSRVRTLNFRRENSGCLRNRWMRSPGKLSSGERRGAKVAILYGCLSESMSSPSLRTRKQGRGGRKSAWLGKELLLYRRKRGASTGSGNKDMSSMKNTRMLSRNAEMGLGKPRHR